MSNKNKNLLEAHQLYKTYSKSNTLKEDIIKGLHFEMAASERVAIEGASGSGKSTLLYLLASLEVPDSGEIYFEGESFSALSSELLCQIRNQKIGFVFQFHHLLKNMNLIDNVRLPCQIADLISTKDSIDKAEFLLEQVGLYSRKAAYPTELSGGEQQRVAIARSMVMDPKLILADEPTGNLDAANASKVLDLLIKLSERNASALLLVSHNTEITLRMNKRYELKQGVLFLKS